MEILKNRSLKIVFVTEAYWGVLNGVVMMVMLLAAELVARGHHVTIVTSSWNQRKPTVVDGVNVYTVRGLPIGATGYSMAFPWLSKAAIRIMSEADIIHTHHPFLLGRWAQQFGKPVFFTSHTNYVAYLHYVPLLGPSLQTWLESYLVAFCNLCVAVIAPAQAASDRLVQYGVVRTPTVIPNGIDTKMFQGGNRALWRSKLKLSVDEKLLIYVGRLAKEKRVEMCIRASCHQSQLPHLLIVGTGPSDQDLRQLVKNLDAESRIHFLGQLDHAELPDLYAAADAFITASDSEVHPLVVIEAQAAGLPAVVVKAPGVSEIVRDHWTGLVTENTQDGFEMGIKELLDHPRLLKQYGLAARQYAKKFSVSSSVDALEKLYYSV